MGDEDGEIEVYAEGLGRRAAALYRKIRGKKKSEAGKKLVGGRLVAMSAKEKANRKKGAKAGHKGPRKRMAADFDPSEVSADDAVAIGEQELDEYTVGSQTRPSNVTVWRTVGGELKKVKRWTSTGKKGINKGPKSAAHKTAISKAMKRVWKAGGARRKASGGASEESYDPTNDVSALLTGEELLEEFKEKASTIFEAAVNNEVDKQLALAEAEVHTVFDSAIDEAKTELTEQLDNYFDYVFRPMV